MEPNTEDEFKDFGEGFAGFPKHRPEDCVEYRLFIIDSKFKSQRELLSRLEIVRKESLNISSDLLKDYIWQRDPFKLEVKTEKGMIYLQGVTNYGDSAEDEWLIVYILRELSNRFSNLWIKIVDSDGEFLLIEAASALPQWLNPDVADNRIWINKNSLRIIPLTATTPLDAKNKMSRSKALELEVALKIIDFTPDILIHSPLIEAEAFYRLGKYPAQITASLHHGLITIPRKLAYILHSRSAAIAQATEAFYLRDPISLRLLQSSASELVFPPDDLVIVSTRFTKVLYAQLKSQEFTPPALWQGFLSRCADEVASGKAPRDVYTRLEMGMKVTSGFEMLISDTQHKDNPVVREIRILMDDLDADEAATLPSDEEIMKWVDVDREDDEKWLDINFEDFERELQGKNRKHNSKSAPVFFGPERPPALRKGQKLPHTDLSLGSDPPPTFSDLSSPEPPPTFGDPHTQAYLRKHVERFEAMMNGERPSEGDASYHEGLDVSGKHDDWESEESDDSEDYEEGEDSEDEDKVVSFDEEEFSRMMKEMMGMPADEDGGQGKDSEKSTASEVEGGRIEKVNTSEDEDEDEDEDGYESRQIQDVMQRMEAELQEAGALNLDLTSAEPPSLKGKGKAVQTEHNNATEFSDDESDDDVNIDFNAARRLLESLQAQAGTGMEGPAANLLNMMGIQSLQDEAEGEASDKKI